MTEQYSRTEYLVYLKHDGHWFNKTFAAKEREPQNNFAIIKEQAQKLAGQKGRVWQIDTTRTEIYKGTNAPE